MASSFFKDLFSVFRSRTAVIAFGLITSIVTARVLGPEGNGVIAAIMVYPSLFLSLGSLGIRQSTTYFVGQKKFSLDDIYASTLAIWLLTSILCLVSCFVLIKYFTKGEYSNLLIALALITIPFSLYNTYTSGIFLGRQNIKEFNQINWIPAALNFFFTTLLITVIPLGVAGSMIGTFLGVFVLSFFVISKIRRDLIIRVSFKWEIIKPMLSLGIIYAVSLLVINLNYKADILLLERLSNNYELGIYSKGVGIIQYLWEVPMLLSTLIFSRSASAKDPKAFSKKVCQLLRFAIPLVFIASLILFLLADILIELMYGFQFKPSGSVLKILMPGVVLLTIFKVLNMDVAGKGKPWLSMKAMIPAVVLNIVLNYYWVPEYGANGSALASTISYSLAGILFIKLYSKEMGIPIIKMLRFTREDKELLITTLFGLKNKLLVK